MVRHKIITLCRFSGANPPFDKLRIQNVFQRLKLRNSEKDVLESKGIENISMEIVIVSK
jgi:hypothetical protein